MEEKITTIVSLGWDEIYCNWYECLNCHDEYITEKSNFCPNCGFKIVCNGNKS